MITDSCATQPGSEEDTDEEEEEEEEPEETEEETTPPPRKRPGCFFLIESRIGDMCSCRLSDTQASIQIKEIHLL